MDGLVFGSSHLLYSRYPLVSFNNGSGYLGGILAVSLARYCGIIIKLAGLTFRKVFNKFATFSWRNDLEHWFNIGCRQIYKAPQDSTSAYDLISGLHVEPYHDRKERRKSLVRWATYMTENLRTERPMNSPRMIGQATWILIILALPNSAMISTLCFGLPHLSTSTSRPSSALFDQVENHQLDSAIRCNHLLSPRKSVVYSLTLNSLLINARNALCRESEG